MTATPSRGRRAGLTRLFAAVRVGKLPTPALLAGLLVVWLVCLGIDPDIAGGGLVVLGVLVALMPRSPRP